MGARIRIQVVGVEGPEKDDVLRRLDDVLQAAGYPKVEPPKPARHLRAVTASGEGQQ